MSERWKHKRKKRSSAKKDYHRSFFCERECKIHPPESLEHSCEVCYGESDNGIPSEPSCVPFVRDASLHLGRFVGLFAANGGILARFSSHHTLNRSILWHSFGKKREWASWTAPLFLSHGLEGPCGTLLN